MKRRSAGGRGPEATGPGGRTVDAAVGTAVARRLRERALPLFLAAAAAIHLAAGYAARAATGSPGADLVALAATVDTTLLVPLLYYLLLVRGRGWPAASTLPVFLASLVVAGLTLPAEGRAALGTLRHLALPAELVLLVLVARKLRAGRAALARGRRGTGDALEGARMAAEEMLGGPSRLAEILASEVAVLHYALFSWRGGHAGGDGAEGELAFPYHRKTAYGAVVFALLLALTAEALALHLLVQRWSAVGAWLLTAGSAYAALWLVADYRAARLRPIVVGRERLLLRLGIRWTASVPLATVAGVEEPGAAVRGAAVGGARVRAGGAGEAAAPGCADAAGAAVEGGETRDPDLSLALPGARTAVLALSEPVEAVGVYGIRRRVSRIAVAADDLEGLLAAVRERSASSGPGRGG